MYNLAKVLTGLSALAFVLAVVTNFTGVLLNTPAEGYSRACTNLAVLAIALVVSFGDRGVSPGRSGTPL
jgi:predicted Kef-type K+ transport protein